MQKKIQDKSVEVKANYEIESTKIFNGMVYLKISQDKRHYKWIKYSTAIESSKDFEVLAK